MKKTLLIGLALGASVVALSAGTSFGAISGSAHDLSTRTGGAYKNNADTQGRICIYCHTPHNAVRATDGTASSVLNYSPLWNRAFQPNAAFTNGYTMYNNGTGITADGLTDNGMVVDIEGVGETANRHVMNGTPRMSGISLLCMSCHDGVTAVNAFSATTGIDSEAGLYNGTVVMGSTYTIGKNAVGAAAGDLSNHHPIGMSWDDSRAGDPEIAPKTDAFKADLTIEDVLQGGDVFTCASCHDVHNYAGNDAFLHIPNDASAFCLTCHLK